jgi:hypothetical protein
MTMAKRTKKPVNGGEFRAFPSLLQVLTYTAMLKRSITDNYCKLSARDKRELLFKLKEVRSFVHVDDRYEGD